MSNLSTLQCYPLPSSSSLTDQFVGKTLNELSTPAVVLDRAIIKRNCNAMLNVCKELGVGFRAHVKSHKTKELSKLQVGEEGTANFIVSTIIEAENLAELVLEEQGKGREASVCFSLLYSILHFFCDDVLLSIRLSWDTEFWVSSITQRLLCTHHSRREGNRFTDVTCVDPLWRTGSAIRYTTPDSSGRETWTAIC